MDFPCVIIEVTRSEYFILNYAYIVFIDKYKRVRDWQHEEMTFDYAPIHNLWKDAWFVSAQKRTVQILYKKLCTLHICETWYPNCSRKKGTEITFTTYQWKMLSATTGLIWTCLLVGFARGLAFNNHFEPGTSKKSLAYSSI